MAEERTVPSDEEECAGKIAADLRLLGVRPGDILLVHSSLRSLGYVPGGCETVVRGILDALGSEGTLLMPALSYAQKPFDVHDTLRTPSCVGAIPEHFRRRQGTMRSVHPTHSVCGTGRQAADILRHHIRDSTPCGRCSPFNLICDRGAKIVMLGCGLKPNTTMHALEEYVNPPYLLDGECVFYLRDADGRTFHKAYRVHDFRGWRQRYDRVERLPDAGLFLARGRVLAAETFVIDAAGMKKAVLAALRKDPLAFVEPCAQQDAGNEEE